MKQKTAPLGTVSSLKLVFLMYFKPVGFSWLFHKFRNLITKFYKIDSWC